jgi:hypothetical protein
MNAKHIDKYTIKVTLDNGEVRILRNKKAQQRAKKRKEFAINAVLMIVGIAMMLFFIYAWLCGPYDYWTKEGNVMVQYHVDWNGNETVIDSYELDPYYN